MAYLPEFGNAISYESFEPSENKNVVSVFPKTESTSERADFESDVRTITRYVEESFFIEPTKPLSTAFLSETETNLFGISRERSVFFTESIRAFKMSSRSDSEIFRFLKPGASRRKAFNLASSQLDRMFDSYSANIRSSGTFPVTWDGFGRFVEVVVEAKAETGEVTATNPASEPARVRSANMGSMGECWKIRFYESLTMVCVMSKRQKKRAGSTALFTSIANALISQAPRT